MLPNFLVVSAANDRRGGWSNKWSSIHPLSLHSMAKDIVKSPALEKIIDFNPLMSHKEYKDFNFNDNLMLHFLNSIKYWKL